MTTHTPTLLQQFRSFCFQNHPKDFDDAIEYFAVFGGMGWNVDMSLPLWDIIESKILKNYRYIHADITQITKSNNIYHALLTALATGDRREHSAFKKAKVTREGGEHAIDFLVEQGLLKREASIVKPANKDDEISDKLLFVHPFMRFWFASISPYYKGIKEGNFQEVKEKFANREQGFSDLIYDQLIREHVKKVFKDDTIFKIGSYWDKNVEIDILARTKSGKVIAGVCKYSNAKVKKSELNKLKEKCALADIKPDIFVIFSKNGFSNELKSEKGETLKLYTQKSLKNMMDDLSSHDLIEPWGKRY